MNKKQLGKMKDEYYDVPVTEFVGVLANINAI